MTNDIVELQSGFARVRIAPLLGGRITAAELECADGAVLRILHPYPESARQLLPWAKGGLYPLVPYSGRIRDARLLHEGSVHALTPHPGGEPHTLHGIAQQRPWTLERAADGEAVLHYEHRPDGHWPWHFKVRMTVALQRSRLDIVLALRNTDHRRMPAGIGLHPYLSYCAGDELAFHASPAWPFDAEYMALPKAQEARRRVEVPATRFEACEVTQFHGDWDGVIILRGSAGRSLRLLADEGLRHVVIHRPNGAGYVCVEPVSHVADGFNLHAQGHAGTGTRVLGPGETLRGCLRIDCLREGPSDLG